MKPTRTLIPVLTFVAATLLVAQNNPGQPEPFPAPGDPLPPAPTTKPAPVPVTPAPATPKPVPAPITIPAPAPVPAPALVPPATPAPTTQPTAPEVAQQPVTNPSIGLGIVNGTRVSARGKATIFSALVFQFNKNEPLNILEEINLTDPKAGEPRKWYRVQVPEDAGLWVHANFLHPATTIQGVNAQNQPVKLNVAVIRANLLNVRGGAGEEFPILSKLPRGAQVILTGASKAKWREVLAPQNASVYVAAKFITRQKITSGVVEMPEQAGSSPAVTPPATNPTLPTQPIPSVQQTKPTPAPTPAPPVEAKKLNQTNPLTPEGVENNSNPSVIKPNPLPEAATKPTPTKSIPTVKPVQSTKVNPALPAPATTKPSTDARVRIVHREGKVRRTLDIRSPSGYVLEHLESGKKINYLVLDEKAPLKLKWFVGKKVSVSGEEALDKRKSKTPVLLVSTLKGELSREFIARLSTAKAEAMKKEKQKEPVSEKQSPASEEPKKADQRKEKSEEEK